MAELYANSEDPDQTPHSAASDLGLQCLPVTLLGVSRLQWVKILRQQMGRAYLFRGHSKAKIVRSSTSICGMQIKFTPLSITLNDLSMVLNRMILHHSILYEIHVKVNTNTNKGEHSQLKVLPSSNEYGSKPQIPCSLHEDNRVHITQINKNINFLQTALKLLTITG